MAGLIDRYRDRLPFAAGDPIISLDEGSTPLLYACELSDRLGAQVWLKIEGANPTGSFKDRGMTCAVSGAVRDGSTAVVCASTGNTAASAAAYAARARITCAVIVPDGKIARGKLAQAVMHGARVIGLRGNFDEALRLVRELSANHPIALVNSVNPLRIEGQKTELQKPEGLEIITPHASHARGAQLSLLIAKDSQARYEAFKAAGLACDHRESGRGIAGEGIIRLAPAPLFNTFDEVWRAAEIVRNAMRA